MLESTGNGGPSPIPLFALLSGFRKWIRAGSATISKGGQAAHLFCFGLCIMKAGTIEKTEKEILRMKNKATVRPLFRRFLAFLTAVCLLPLAGCGNKQEESSAVTVMATFYPVYVLAENVLEGVEGVELIGLRNVRDILNVLAARSRA